MNYQLYSTERAAVEAAKMQAGVMRAAIGRKRGEHERANPLLHEAGHAVIRLGIALVEAGTKMAHPLPAQRTLAHK